MKEIQNIAVLLGAKGELTTIVFKIFEHNKQQYKRRDKRYNTIGRRGAKVPKRGKKRKEKKRTLCGAFDSIGYKACLFMIILCAPNTCFETPT